MAKNELLTTDEVAERLRVSKQTIRNMIDRGELRAVKVGRQYRVVSADVDNLLSVLSPVLIADKEGQK